MKKLRILCLHGYHGSADILRRQTERLTNASNHLAEFVFLDALSLAKGDYGWWHANMDKHSAEYYSSAGVGSGTMVYNGWSNTREYVVSQFQHAGPFDGIFGFSQGAALTGLLVGLRHPQGLPTEDKPLTFDFAIMVGGFLARDPSLETLYDNRESYDLPSVHMIGTADTIVSPEQSRLLAAKFNRPLVLQHSGGHVVPGASEIRDSVARFLEQRLQTDKTR